jgi:hypothetical protein
MANDSEANQGWWGLSGTVAHLPISVPGRAKTFDGNVTLWEDDFPIGKLK